MKRILSLLLLAAISLGLPVTSSAQDFPTRPLRLVVPYAPGGGTDILARVVAQGMSEELGQPVMVENRTGAGTQVGSSLVAKSAADGYTLLMATISHSINPALYKALPYDSINDFAPVAQIASVPLIIVVSPTLPVSNVRELIALAKAKPGQLNNAMAPGSMPHLAAEMFKKVAGVEIVAIAYKGNSPAYPDLMAGRVQLMFDALSSGLPQVQGGKLKGIAVTSAQRSLSAPNIPTVAESGLPGFEAEPWYGVLAPAGTPPAVVNKLNAAIHKAVQTGPIQQKLRDLGYTIKIDSPAQFASYIKSEMTKWGIVVKEAGVSAE